MWICLHLSCVEFTKLPESVGLCCFTPNLRCSANISLNIFWVPFSVFSFYGAPMMQMQILNDILSHRILRSCLLFCSIFSMLSQLGKFYQSVLKFIDSSSFFFKSPLKYWAIQKFFKNSFIVFFSSIILIWFFYKFDCSYEIFICLKIICNCLLKHFDMDALKSLSDNSIT